MLPTIDFTGTGMAGSSAGAISDRLARSLDDRAAAELHLALASGARSLVLDGSEVEAASFAAVQVLFAAMRGPAGISIRNPSAALNAAFADLGLDFTPAPTPAPQPMAAAEPTPIVVKGPGTKRILTIDDSKTIRQMLLLTLEEAGFEVLQAVDGQDGLDVMAKEKSVDVVITDINMPRMDGYGVIRALRAMPVHQKLPILVLTTESEAEKKNLARDIGATGWVVKPFDPERLIAAIRTVSQPAEA